MQASPSSQQVVELFVIQRCWFSGPNVEPSADCRRLFTSRREAEEVAYHSAHAFANQIYARIISSSFTNPTRQHVNAAVKTILLPPSALGPTSSYAFQTCGKLFWVRSLKATVVPPAATGGGLAYSSAEVILTEGIIGGTGNRNSRRGSEVAEGRVFVSMDPSNANRCAVDAARQLHLSMTHNPHVTINVMSLPIGKTNNHQSSHSLAAAAQDWPETPQQQQWAVATDPMMTIMSDPSAKREWGADISPTASSSLAAAALIDYGFDPRENHNLPSKRQCQVFRQETKQESAAVPCTMMLG